MPDILLILGWFLHMGLLVAAGCYVAKRLGYPLRDWPFIGFLFAWANLVIAELGASLLHCLNQLPVLLACSVAAGLLLFAGLKLNNENSAALIAAPKLNFANVSPNLKRILFWVLGITFGIVVALNLVIIISSNPDNADSIIYRLPRAFWYVSQGSFMHPFDAVDKRLVFYPLDGVSLYVPMVLYAVPGVFYNFPSIFMWLAIIYATYRFGREMGAQRIICFFAAWLVGLTPSIMAQAISTNDEIITAAAFVVGLYMGWCWLTRGNRSYFVLMAIGFGLCVGTKLHIVFLLPSIALALFYLAYSGYKQPVLLQRWGQAIGWRGGVIALSMLLLVSASFLLYNYASVGRFYFFDDFKHDVFNWKGRLEGIVQNLAIYLGQMIFAPIADLNVWPDANDRQHFNNLLNELTLPLLKPFISQDRSLYHFTYKFVGVTIPTSVRFVEFSLWSGFVWMLWPFNIGLWLRNQQNFILKYLFALIGLTPVIWILVWSSTTLYMEGTATYFSFYLAVAAPAAIAAFMPIRRSFFSELRWVIILFVAVTNFIIVGNIYAYSGFRSITDIARTSRWPFDWQLFDKTVVDEIRLAQKMRVVYTHEKMPYFGFMRWNPKAVMLNPYKPPAAEDHALQIIPITSMNQAGYMPVKIPEKLTLGATFLGLIRGIGREAIFAVGNDVEKRHPMESDYIIPQMGMRMTEMGFAIAFPSEGIIGYSPDDNLEYRYEIYRGLNSIYIRDWKKDIGFGTILPTDPTNEYYKIKISVRSAWSQKILAEQSYQLFGIGAWLPDGPDY